MVGSGTFAYSFGLVTTAAAVLGVEILGARGLFAYPSNNCGVLGRLRQTNFRPRR